MVPVVDLTSTYLAALSEGYESMSDKSYYPFNLYIHFDPRFPCGGHLEMNQ